MSIYIYIYIWSGLLTKFLTSLRSCVLNLYKSGVTYSLKSTPNDRFFEKLFMAILFTLSVFPRNLLRGNHRRNTFRISFWCLAWDSNPGFSSDKPTQLTRPRQLLWLHEYCSLKLQLYLVCRRNTYLWRHPTNNSPTVSNRSSEVAKRYQFCGW